jgi:hypothetical protein
MSDNSWESAENPNAGDTYWLMDNKDHCLVSRLAQCRADVQEASQYVKGKG